MLVFNARYTLGSLQDKFDSVVTNNGSTIMVNTPKGFAIRLNGSSQWISYAGTRSVKSVVVWLNAKALSKDIIDFDGGTHSIEVGAANVTATGFVSPSITIDTVSTPVLSTNKIVCLVVTTATAFNATALKIGKETSYFNGDILCVKLFDNQLSFNEILQEQAEFTAAQPISKAKRGFIRNRIDDLSREVNNTVGSELVVNGDFETWSSTIPTSWTKGANVVTVNKITSGQYSGNNSIEIVGVGTASNTINNSVYQVNTFSKDGWYLISGYVKLSSGSGNSYIGYQNDLLTISGTSEYVFYSKKIYAVAGNIFNLSCAVGSTYQFDNISVRSLSDLIAAYSFNKRGSINVDISGNNFNSTSLNTINTKNGLLYNGINSKDTIGNIGNVNSVSFRIKPTSTTCKIMEGRANAALIYIASGTLTASDFANIYVNGVASTAMVANQWQTVTLTSSSSVSFSACTLGLNNTTYGAFEIADLRIWNRALSLNYEIKQYHSQFILPTFLEDMSDYSVTDTI